MKTFNCNFEGEIKAYHGQDLHIFKHVNKTWKKSIEKHYYFEEEEIPDYDPDPFEKGSVYGIDNYDYRFDDDPRDY